MLIKNISFLGPHFGGVLGEKPQKFSGDKIAFAAQQIYTKIWYWCCVVQKKSAQNLKSKKIKKLDAAKSVGRDERISYNIEPWEKIFAVLNPFLNKTAFYTNFWSSFRVLNLKLRDSLPWNLAQTNNLWISNCCQNFM